MKNILLANVISPTFELIYQTFQTLANAGTNIHSMNPPLLKTSLLTLCNILPRNVLSEYTYLTLKFHGVSSFCNCIYFLQISLVFVEVNNAYTAGFIKLVIYQLLLLFKEVKTQTCFFIISIFQISSLCKLFRQESLSTQKFLQILKLLHALMSMKSFHYVSWRKCTYYKQNIEILLVAYNLY